MTRFLHRRHLADYVALVYVVAYFAWLATRAPGTPHSVLVGTLAFYPLGLVIGWAFLRNALLARLDRRTRLAWATLGIAALILWFGGAFWQSLIDYFTVPRPFGALDLEEFQHVLVLVALLIFPRRRVAARERTVFRLNVGLVVVAGFILAFNYSLLISLREPAPESLGEAVAQSVLDWIVFCAAAVGVLNKRDATTRGAVTWLLAANLLYLWGNDVFGSTVDYHTGDALDGLYFAAWGCRWAAARYAWHRYRQAGWPSEAETEPRGVEYRSSVFSYVIVAGAFVLLLAQIIGGDRQFLWLSTVSAAIMVTLLVVRQVVELRENRRLYESHLAQEKRFRSLVQHSSDVVIIVDAGGVISYVSPSADAVFGPGSIAADRRVDAMLPPADAATLAAAFEGGASGGRLQSRMTPASGRAIDVEIVWTDLRSDETVAGIVLNCRDVTERDELERQLRHTQKLDAVGHLAGGLAHDFNNVLTAIRGYTELLAEDLPAQSRAAGDVQHIEHAVDRAAAVTRQLLAFSRKQAVQLVVLDLNGVLRDLAPLLDQLLTDHIEMRIDAGDGAWPVKADQGQLEQVIVNLATNARDAMPNGGAIRIATQNRRIEASPPGANVLPGDYLALAVSDQGVGMTDDVRAHIFEPFFSTKSKERGIGLGLAMVHGIVAQSGGHVLVDTAVGRGTTFTVLLPRVHQAARESLAPQDAAHESRDASRTILVVDDESSVRAVARRMLERAGFAVMESASGQAALDLAADQAKPIDLLLTDMVMPGLPGRDLITQFRRARPGVPIVCVTGYAGEAHDVADAEQGIAAIVTKPFSSQVLLRAVRGAWRAMPVA